MPVRLRLICLRDACRYPTLSDKRATPISTTPLSLTVTDFHYLLLYADRLVAVGRLNEQVVYEELLPRVRRWPLGVDVAANSRAHPCALGG